MNIQCSACGAPLSSGAHGNGVRTCPACALPLTASAMPTPAPVRRPAPIRPYLVAAFVIFWAVAYASDRQEPAKAQNITVGFDAMYRQSLHQRHADEQ